jgi:tRNA pseudouridine32 synthase/23S rRNA pseudouridine746 synthase
MAEFWVGAPSRSEVRKEGVFYAPCSGKCVPILRHMLRGIKIDSESQEKRTKELLKDTEIIYDDRYLMVLNKPSGVLSTPGKGEVLSMEEYIRTTYGLPYCQSVHRLDQDTSGLLVLAKNPDVYKELQSYFQRRDILKRYEAVVSSKHDIPVEGIIELPLLPNPFDRPRQMVDLAHGKPSVTRYAVREKREGGKYLMDFYPLTGRTHQIRVHAAHPDGLNAPIVGDRLYGTAGERLMLHAAEISFIHPITQERMHFCIPSMF